MATRSSGRLRALSRAQQPPPPIVADDEPDNLDAEELDPESEDGDQVGVDVLPGVASDSEASDGDALHAAGVDPEQEEMEEEYQLDDEDDDIEVEDESRTPSVPPKSSLKIKLKMGTTTRTRAAPNRARPRRGRVIRIQSESSESSEEEMPSNTRLTKRQAALAKAKQVDVTDSAEEEEDVDVLDLEPEPELAVVSPAGRGVRNSRAALDPTELALRKEESARKRRNVNERKLQNEKTETINRLLKKQSRPRKNLKKGSAPGPLGNFSAMVLGAGVNASTDIQTPVSEHGIAFGPGDEVGVSVVGMDGGHASAEPMYRWVSTTRSSTTAAVPADEHQHQRQDHDSLPSQSMQLSYSIPAAVLQHLAMPAVPSLPSKSGSKVPAICAVEGCGKDRRYRLVGAEWGVGACGIGHLKVLEMERVP
uniref:INO80 complex subunit B-like conserved region domain-containing protein n=1 Tax=Mycena chlorophos TaxID=658473 RepID=A0ABQ0LGD4_MYCCL|nr:predicted protein [Mycena chlorophos]